MAETPISLLERLRLRPDDQSWQRLVNLYTPLLRNWLGRHALQTSDAEDLTQEALRIVVQELPNFRHDLRQGAFRRWLKNILINRLRTFWRSRRPVAVGGAGDFDQVFDQLQDPASRLSQIWDQEHDQHVVRRLLELLEPEFEPATWQAFRRLALEDQPTAQVAADLGLAVNAVRIAKSRVLRRLREEIAGLVD